MKSHSPRFVMRTPTVVSIICVVSILLLMFGAYFSPRDTKDYAFLSLIFLAGGTFLYGMYEILYPKRFVCDRQNNVCYKERRSFFGVSKKEVCQLSDIKRAYSDKRVVEYRGLPYKRYFLILELNNGEEISIFKPTQLDAPSKIGAQQINDFMMKTHLKKVSIKDSNEVGIVCIVLSLMVAVPFALGHFVK